MEGSGGTPAHAPLHPWVLVQEAVKAILRCLGLETTHDHPDVPPLKPQDSSPPPSTVEADDPPSSTAAELDPPSKPSDPIGDDDPPTTAEGDSPDTFAQSAVSRPPINTGSGAQTN
ncbi:hypothetical protein EUGRSUZ_F02640 [Eucalyptus grandis]|uniref:Uncharacterized protein n=2 Tax=Eucalyptus grandis TaxID=71139 RepID=A0ACC3KIP2_EUCGR|nr:hypothetical protein EUGRSUZ_F02640 [Eucalyptus grandis]